MAASCLPHLLHATRMLPEKPYTLEFYSKPLVDKIGRNTLQSDYERESEDLVNGGVMIKLKQEYFFLGEPKIRFVVCFVTRVVISKARAIIPKI